MRRFFALIRRAEHILERVINFFKKVLTNNTAYVIINFVAERHGSIAQLGEHLPYKQRVTGSSPVVPTTDNR